MALHGTILLFKKKFNVKIIVEFNVILNNEYYRNISKRKIISLSEIQRNPGKAFRDDIVRIVKNGKEIGIFLSKKQCEDIFSKPQEKFYNWSTDEKTLKKNKNTYAAWKLEQMINYGLNGGKISEKALRKYRKKLKLDPDRAKFIDLLLE